jgi:hypothetical protein
MKAIAIKFTAILIVLTLGIITTGKAQTNNAEQSKVFTAFTLKGDNLVNVRTIKPANQAVTINVFDETHKKVLTKKISKSDNLLLTHDITEFPSGTYTYEIKEGRDILNSCKVVKALGNQLKYCTEESMAEANK